MSTKAIIIEDEKSNSSRLLRLVSKIAPDFEILCILESVEDAVIWFANNPAPGLIFMDIQLSDGLSFEIFETINIESPVIFTTAYDEYAIRAFKVNSIDYLLKPIDPEELQRAIEKFRKSEVFTSGFLMNQINGLVKSLTSGGNSYKARFLVRYRNTFISILTEEIALFIVQNQLVYLHTMDGRKFLIEVFLDNLEKCLNPEKFFRINRQIIVNIQGIKLIVDHPGNRLRLQMSASSENEMIVSREKVAAFKIWMDK